MTQTDTPPVYREFAQYIGAGPAARVTIDAAHRALAKFTSPYYGLDVTALTGDLGVSFEWHDGAHYRLTLKADGTLLRLYRLQYTGGWEWDEEEGREVPEEVWRTVRQLQRDRAGKLLGPALADLPAAPSWREAAAR